MAGFQMPKRGSGAAMLRDLREEERPPRDDEPSPLSQEDDAAASATGSRDSSTVAQTTSSTDSNIAADATSSADSSEHGEESKPPRKQRLKVSSPAAHTTSSPEIKTTRSIVGSATVRSKEQFGGDLVRAAMLEMLAQPYPDDMEAGVMTVTSVKIPKPIWERLEYARTITKQDKQDIIAEALRLYFDRIVEGNEE